MRTDNKIRDGKLQYNINREAAKILPFSSRKIDKFDYVIGEEILPLDQRRAIEQAKFAYSPLGKGFDKKTKTIEDQAKSK